MAQQSPFSDESGSPAASSPVTHPAEPSQLDFELDFFSGVLQRFSDYVDVLRLMGHLLTLKGRFHEGLQIDRRLARLRPGDPLVHYNLACSYSLLKRADLSIQTLRRAIELGYSDFRYMREDHDLDFIRHDPRFRQLLREYENR
jgi:tetratricopeptide (TPR) repeat protein